MSSFQPRAARRILCALVIGGAAECAFSAPAGAQFSPWATFPLAFADARVLPRGVLRIAFAPSYASYDSRFAAAGTVEPLGADLTADTAGSNVLWSLGSAEQAVRRIMGDSTYRMTLGSLRTQLDADVRRIPLDVAFGITDRLTLTARVSLVKTRMQAVVTLDSTQGNVGWSQLTSQANNAAAAAQITTLVSQLGTAVQSLENQINGGGYGCPSGPSCAPAMAALARARALLDGLTTLTDAAMPVAPLGTSAAGTAVRAEVTAVIAQLQSLGLGPFTGSLALPGKTLTATDFQTLLGAPAFGYDLRPIETTDISRIGDTEVGLRFGLIQRPAVRLVLHAAARLPTASRDSIDHVVDLGTGDRQLDAELGLEASLEGEALGLSAGAVFTRQFADNLTLRPLAARPLMPATFNGPYRRDLGDVVQLSAYPSIRLNPAFRVYALAHYYRKSGDTYEYAGPQTPEVPATTQTEAASALNLGGGIHYRAERAGAEEVRLPVEAGLSYQAAYRGEAGTTPKSTMLNLYLRLYYQIF
ncbi:MAG: hypothetical protein HY337_01520 [Gemmatimonadetes bacterium]|nr:hypothetical protein [Gemmatimonadota bacterium]